MGLLDSRYRNRPIADALFIPILAAALGAALGAGIAMRGVKTTAAVPAVAADSPVPATLVLQKRPGPRPEKKDIVRTPRPRRPRRARQPVDLTDNPALAKQEDTKAAPASGRKKTRRVYGLNKVYSRGIGARGAMEDAIVGKLGNTLSKQFDTLRATEDEIKGAVVSTTTVTAAPRFRKRVKPSYTERMLAHRIEGVVKVRLLVDIDGRVKKAVALNDIGCDAARQAVTASLRMEFEPAKRGEQPVAVWIIVPMRFVMLT
jgi:TonB family protein